MCIRDRVYVVRGGALGEVMVPAVSSVIVAMDVDAGRIVVDPVALDLPKKPPRRRRRHEVTRRSRKQARAAKAEARARARGESAAGEESAARGESAAGEESAAPSDPAATEGET